MCVCVCVWTLRDTLVLWSLTSPNRTPFKEVSIRKVCREEFRIALNSNIWKPEVKLKYVDATPDSASLTARSEWREMEKLFMLQLVMIISHGLPAFYQLFFSAHSRWQSPPTSTPPHPTRGKKYTEEHVHILLVTHVNRCKLIKRGWWTVTPICSLHVNPLRC